MSEAQYDHSEAGQGDSPRRQADDHASDDADEYSPRGGGATPEGRATPGQHYDGPASDSSPARRRARERGAPLWLGHHEGQDGVRGARMRERARERLAGLVMVCRDLVVTKWCVEAAAGRWLAAAEFALLAVVAKLALSSAAAADNRQRILDTWFNAMASAKLAVGLAVHFLDSSVSAFILSLVAGLLLVAFMNQANASLFHFVVVFFELTVLVQSGNFANVVA